MRRGSSARPLAQRGARADGGGWCRSLRGSHRSVERTEDVADAIGFDDVDAVENRNRQITRCVDDEGVEDESAGVRRVDGFFVEALEPKATPVKPEFRASSTTPCMTSPMRRRPIFGAVFPTPSSSGANPCLPASRRAPCQSFDPTVATHPSALHDSAAMSTPPTFVFRPFGSRAPEAAVACDGLVEGASLDLSHWRDNRTPKELKADTSVEIALAYALAARATRNVVVNNHFDTRSCDRCGRRGSGPRPPNMP